MRRHLSHELCSWPSFCNSSELASERILRTSRPISRTRAQIGRHWRSHQLVLGCCTLISGWLGFHRTTCTVKRTSRTCSIRFALLSRYKFTPKAHLYLMDSLLGSLGQCPQRIAGHYQHDGDPTASDLRRGRRKRTWLTVVTI